MQALTKNHQSREALQTMTEKAFGTGMFREYRELTEGYFNAAYQVTLTDGREVILKIAPPKGVRVMRYEKGIMHAEIEAMRRVEEIQGVPAPRVLFADESGETCPSPYFFMEKLEGASLNAVREGMSKETIAAVNEESGRICATLNAVVCPKFGYPGQEDVQGEAWLPVFRTMLHMAAQDALDGNVQNGMDYDEMWTLLKRDEAVFAEVTQPKLVHWDIWDGNLFVKGGRVTGVIDWERCLWADPLMEVGFRTYGRNEAFLRGYGMKEMTKAQQRRALWYDIYLLLLMSCETEYRGYETMDFHSWCTGILHKQMELLRQG